MGYPTHIKDIAKYLRGSIEFNIGFMVHKNIYQKYLHAFQRILKKISESITLIEINSDFISKKEKTAIQDLLEGLFINLNSKDLKTLKLSKFSYEITTKITDSITSIPDIKEYEVPIIYPNKPVRLPKNIDLSLHRLIPLIDGRKYIKKLAYHAGITTEIGIKAMKILYACGYIKIIDIFQYSNIYRLTKEFGDFVLDGNKQMECIEYIRGKGEEIEEEEQGVPDNIFGGAPLKISGLEPPTPTRSPGNTPRENSSQLPYSVVTLYANLHKSKTVTEFVSTYCPLNINIPNLIAFGIIHRFLRRVHRYPLLRVLKSDPNLNHCYSTTDDHLTLDKRLNGKYSFDQVSVEFEIGIVEILRKIKQHKNAGATNNSHGPIFGGNMSTWAMSPEPFNKKIRTIMNNTHATKNIKSSINLE